MFERLFKLREHGTDITTEIIAGTTTFMTMAYIIVVNPAILEAAGMPRGPATVATILTAFFGTLVMGVYANRPFAIAPYMGENAFIAYTVCKVLGYSWQTALGAIFTGGVLFTLLTLAGFRQWLAKAIPAGMKYSFAVGIGLFLTFIGLNETGIITLGVPGAPVRVGQLTSAAVLASIFGLLLICFLMLRKVRGSLLIGIVATTLVCYAAGITKLPGKLVSLPPGIGPVFMKLDIAGAFSWGFFAVILTVFVMDFVDTMATLIGVSARAGLLDENGNLPDMEKPMLADALATVFGAIAGTTTSGTFIESAAGVEEGGKTGLTAVTTAVLFLLGLFFIPFIASIPAQAYGPALIVVGILMFTSIRKIDMDDYTEFIPAFIVIILMSFTYNIGIGLTAGFILYPLFKVITGRMREIHAGMWVLAALSLLFFVFYPY